MYGVRFNATFKSDQGKEYFITISEKDYIGTDITFDLGGDGFTLTYRANEGSGSICQGVVGSKCEFTMFVRDNDTLTFIQDLTESDDKQFLIKVFLKTGEFTLQDYWIGYIFSDLLSWKDSPFPIPVRITAACGLGWVEQVPFKDLNGPFTGSFTHSELLQNTLNLIGIVDQFQTNDILYVSETNTIKPDGINKNKILDKLQVDANVFSICDVVKDEYDPATGAIEFTHTYKTYGDVLKFLCLYHNARLFQANGRYYFIGNASYQTSQITYRKYALNDFTGNSTVSESIIYNNYNRLAGGKFGYLAPKNNVEAKYSFFFDPIELVDNSSYMQSWEADYFPCDIEINYSIDGIKAYWGDGNITISTRPTYKGEINYNYLRGFPVNVRFFDWVRIRVGEWYYYNRYVFNTTNGTFDFTTNPRWVRDRSKTVKGTGTLTITLNDIDDGIIPELEDIIYVELNGTPLIINEDYNLLIGSGGGFIQKIGGLWETEDTIYISFAYSEYAYYQVWLGTAGFTLANRVEYGDDPTAGNIEDASLLPGTRTLNIPPCPDSGKINVSVTQIARPVVGNINEPTVLGNVTFASYPFYKLTNDLFATYGVNDQLYPNEQADIFSDLTNPKHARKIVMQVTENISDFSIKATYSCTPQPNGEVSYIATNTNSDQSDSQTVNLLSSDSIYDSDPIAGAQNVVPYIDKSQTLVKDSGDFVPPLGWSIQSNADFLTGTHYEILAKQIIGLQAKPAQTYTGRIFCSDLYGYFQSLELDVFNTSGKPIFTPLSYSFNANFDEVQGTWARILANYADVE